MQRICLKPARTYTRFRSCWGMPTCGTRWCTSIFHGFICIRQRARLTRSNSPTPAWLEDRESCCPMSQPTVELADIVRALGNDFIVRNRSWLTWPQVRVLLAIQRCRTAALGGHLDGCSRCGHQAISYNSCRNRHCPRCQTSARNRWLAERSNELLPVCRALLGALRPDNTNGASSVSGLFTCPRCGGAMLLIQQLTELTLRVHATRAGFNDTS